MKQHLLKQDRSKQHLSKPGFFAHYEQLIAICISTVFVMAGQGVISPVLPIYADSFGVSTAMIGATVTAFGLARLVTNVPAGLL